MGDVTQTPISEPKTPEMWIIENLQTRVNRLERILDFLVNSCPEAQRFMRDFAKQERKKR